MNGKEKEYLEELMKRYPVLKGVRLQIEDAFEMLLNCYLTGGKLLVSGNGGSAADAEHMVGELMKSFKRKRTLSCDRVNQLLEIGGKRGEYLGNSLDESLPAICLNNHYALSSAVINDVDGNLCYAQQVWGYGQKNDVYMGISTSGASENIILAAIAARAKGMKVIALTGKDGGTLKDYADCCIIVPGNETYMIQELHLPIYHCLCLMLEEHFYNKMEAR